MRYCSNLLEQPIPAIFIVCWYLPLPLPFSLLVCMCYQSANCLDPFVRGIVLEIVASIADCLSTCPAADTSSFLKSLEEHALAALAPVPQHPSMLLELAELAVAKCQATRRRKTDEGKVSINESAGATEQPSSSAAGDGKQKREASGALTPISIPKPKPLAPTLKRSNAESILQFLLSYPLTKSQSIRAGVLALRLLTSYPILDVPTNSPVSLAATLVKHSGSGAVELLLKATFDADTVVVRALRNSFD